MTGPDDEMRLADGAADALARIHHSAAGVIDDVGAAPGGDLGQGGPQIVAVCEQLARLGEAVAKEHSSLAVRVQVAAHGFVTTDAGVQDAFADLRGR